MANKPAGLACDRHGSAGRASLTDLLGRMVGRGSPPPLFLLTPLDRDASGLAAYARSGAVAQAVSARLRHRRARRGYLAVVHGDLPEGETRTVQSHLVLNARGVPEPVDPAERHGDDPVKATIHVRGVKAGRGVSLVRIRPETDLSLQVRAQLAEIGHPVVGDRAFPPRDEIKAQAPRAERLALLADELVIPAKDPGGEALTLRLRTPAWFEDLLGGRAPREAGEMRGAEGVSSAVEWSTDEGGLGVGDGGARRPAGSDEADGSWSHVAAWYADLLESGRGDLHDEVVHPGVLGLLVPGPGERVLDVACGEGTLAGLVAERGASVTGVDLSEDLVRRARESSPERLDFRVGDARRLGDALGAGEPGYDAACCVLALMNIDDLGAVCAGLAGALRPGGRAVIVVLHPAFRAPGRTSWGWVRTGDGGERQFRRVDAYLSEDRHEIVMHPGRAARGDGESGGPITTVSHHRPIGSYVNALSCAGLAVDRVEEWASHRRSEAGPRAVEEDRARREIPMFLAVRAVKPRGGETGRGDDPVPEAGVGGGVAQP